MPKPPPHWSAGRRRSVAVKTKKAVITAPGKLEFQFFEEREPGDDEVLVKVTHAGICTWEQKYFKGVPGSYPFVGGHEIAGTVEAVGPKVAQSLKKGDKVVVASLTRCGECYFCRRGLDNLCENTGSESTPGGMWGPGGFSEYFVAKGYEVFKVDGGVDLKYGTLAEPLACVLRSMDRSRIEIGDTALITGGGVMGLIHVILAKSRGARVVMSEPEKARREAASEFGADFTVDPLGESVSDFIKERTGGRGCEAVFYTAGGAPAINQGIESLVNNGTLVVYGATEKKDRLELDPKLFHYNEIYITGVTKHTKDGFRRAAELISDGDERFEKLISAVYPFEDAETAFQRSVQMDTYRVILSMQ